MDKKLETDIHQRDRGALSLQPLPCLGPESVADTEMASSMWEERDRRRGAGRRAGSFLCCFQIQAQRDSRRAWGEGGSGLDCRTLAKGTGAGAGRVGQGMLGPLVRLPCCGVPWF